MFCKYLQSREFLSSSTSRFPASGQSSSSRVDLSFLLTDFKNFITDESATIDNDGMCVPPLACSFAKIKRHQHIVGVVDEDGFLVLYNTLKTGSASVVKTWQVHTNAVFDLEWLQQEEKILTGSGDQTIALHDIETCTKLDTFRGHSSSIKSISSHTSNDAIFVSGSRDGHIMMWDRRVTRRDGYVPPVNTIYNAHMVQPQHLSSGKQRKKRTSSGPRDAQQSVTSVLFQDDNYVISAGAVDGCLKVWDIRKTYKVKVSGAAPVHVFSYPGSNSRRHGYTSLVLDSQRLRLFASCTDDVIYEYDMACYNPKPVQSWRGHKNSTFYVKTALSPNDQFLLSGSSDDKAYIWDIKRPGSSPVVLESHTAEVTSVAWCPSDITKIVTLSDDTKIKLWRIYCRELKRECLPERSGHARKLSKERATSTDKVDRTSDEHPHLNVTPKQSLQKSSSAPASAQSCMKTWLKTSVCLPIQRKQRSSSQRSDSKTGFCSKTTAEVTKDCDTQQRDSLKLSTICEKALSKSATTSGVSPSYSAEKQASPICSDCELDKGTKLESSPLCSSSDILSSCDYSENASSESDLSSPVYVAKIKHRSLILQTQSSKSHEHAIGHDEENVSPQKLKRRLSSTSSPVPSPKRPCLTNITPSNQAQDACFVKKNLFSGDDKVNPDDDSTTSNKDIKTNTNPRPISPTLKDEVKDASDQKRDCASCGKLLSEPNDDLNSPTLNLPNLVLDQANRLNVTPGRRKDNARPKQDWLTRLRMEKQGKTPESKQAVMTSPKHFHFQVTKRMKKIQSYFKSKDA